MSLEIPSFRVAGTELTWPIGTAAGMSNHPDIEVVARRFEDLLALGLGESVLGSLKLGDPNGGNAHVKLPDGNWDYIGGDEYADIERGIGHNAKGLPGPGLDIGLSRFPDFVDLGRSKDVEVSLSVSPHTQNPLEEVPELLDAAEKALKMGALRVEFNLSCPNIPDRPAFYRDPESVRSFVQMTSAKSAKLRNRFDHPGVYAKFGPMSRNSDEISLQIYIWDAVNRGVFGGVVTSNTDLGDGHILPNGENAIRVNGGRAGRSGPFYEVEGRGQLDDWVWSRRRNNGDIINALGISTAQEVIKRLQIGASLCQLASVIYWPKLIGEDSSEVVVEKIKRDFSDSYIS